MPYNLKKQNKKVSSWYRSKFESIWCKNQKIAEYTDSVNSGV